MFTHLQTQLRDSQALLLEADQFDYNLFVPWSQLDNLSLRAVGPAGVTPFIKADRAYIRLSLWSLIEGSPVARQVNIDELAIRSLIDKEGPQQPASNRRGVKSSGVAVQPRLG